VGKNASVFYVRKRARKTIVFFVLFDLNPQAMVLFPELDDVVTAAPDEDEIQRQAIGFYQAFSAS
jgi:hypothetical protein